MTKTRSFSRALIVSLAIFSSLVLSAYVQHADDRPHDHLVKRDDVPTCQAWTPNEQVEVIRFPVVKKSDPGNSNYPPFDEYSGTFPVGTDNNAHGNVLLKVTIENNSIELKVELPDNFVPLFPRWIMVKPVYRQGYMNPPNVGYWLDLAADPERNFQFCTHGNQGKISDIVGIIAHKARNG